MYYLVCVDHNNTAAHLTRSDSGFTKCCTSGAVDENDNDMLWNGSKEDGGVGSDCEEEESTNCEDGDSHTDW